MPSPTAGRGGAPSKSGPWSTAKPDLESGISEPCDSSVLLISRGGILRPLWNSPEIRTPHSSRGTPWPYGGACRHLPPAVPHHGLRHARLQGVRGWPIYIYIYMYVCMYVCMYIYIYIYIYMHGDHARVVGTDCGGGSPREMAVISCIWLTPPFADPAGQIPRAIHYYYYYYY